MTKSNQLRFAAMFPALVIIMFALTCYSINIGVYPVPLERVISTLFGGGTTDENLVIWTLRMPRTATAMLVGICLAVSGAVMQGVTRNPIATPSLLGVSSGSSLGMILIIYLYDQGLGMTIGRPLAAIGGGLAVFGIVYALGLKHDLSPMKLILNGIAVNSCVGAVTLILQMRLTTNAYTTMTVTMGGSLTNADWQTIAIGYAIAIPCLIFVIYKCYCLNILTLGEEMAIGLGIDLKKERKHLLFVTIILTSVSTYVAGGIGFIGMIAPHISKRLVGPNFKLYVPVAVFLGANMVIVADIISREIVKNSSFIPVGTIISLIGAPYLLYLLFAEDR